MPSTTSHASHLSATYDVVLWIEVGVPASNVVMVLPLYGRTCFYPSPVVAARPKQHGSNATSVMSYAEVQKLDAGGRPTRRSWATSSGSCHRGREGDKFAFTAQPGLLGHSCARFCYSTEFRRNSSISVRSETNFMLHISKIHRIDSEIHPNFPEIRPIRLGPNFFPKRIPKPCSCGR
jgi:hypothetical protein